MLYITNKSYLTETRGNVSGGLWSRKSKKSSSSQAAQIATPAQATQVSSLSFTDSRQQSRGVRAANDRLRATPSAGPYAEKAMQKIRWLCGFCFVVINSLMWCDPLIDNNNLIIIIVIIVIIITIIMIVLFLCLSKNSWEVYKSESLWLKGKTYSYWITKL